MFGKKKHASKDRQGFKNDKPESIDISFLKRKYEERLARELGTLSKLKEFINLDQDLQSKPVTTLDYETFKKSYYPKRLSLYEKFCNFSEKILKVKPSPKSEEALTKAIRSCHLNITASGVESSAIMAPLTLLMLTILLTYFLPLTITGQAPLFFTEVSLVLSFVLYFVFKRLPFMIASYWRLKASNQLVLSIFYLVTYMRHTSNLERALNFAAEHLGPPLSLDFKKVLWNVETGLYESVKDSLNAYLETWRDYNLEFVESVQLIIGSLYEPTEDRRLNSLDKALDLMLEETYHRMLHYAHNLKGPITMLHMLGIVLPILGLIILPLAVSFVPEIQWYHIAFVYNLILPVGVYFISKKILSTRPTGYGKVDITEINPELARFKNVRIKFFGNEFRVNPSVFCITLFATLFLLGLTPIIIHTLQPDFDIVLTSQGIVMGKTEFAGGLEFLGYKRAGSSLKGPYGLGAAIFSLFITLGFGFSIGLYHYLRSKDILKIREALTKLEKEFAGALFQLGNRLVDGLPAEIAMEKVADVMQGTVTGKFFETVSRNMRKLGLNLERAIFDENVGAIKDFPSSLIVSSMKVLVESIRKGPVIAGRAMIRISEYVKQMNRVDERLRDLMADTISSMKTQISFLTPIIAGIVIGITSMIITILVNLQAKLQMLGSQTGEAAAQAGAFGGLLQLFSLGIPTYHFQIIVGLYVVEIIYLLSMLSSGLEYGVDKLAERYRIGKNLQRSTLLYVVIALIIMIIFNAIASTILLGAQV